MAEIAAHNEKFINKSNVVTTFVLENKKIFLKGEAK